MGKLTHLSLFSGIGGIDLAASWAGFETVCFVEIDKYCQKVLAKHWPNIPIIEDVKDVTREKVMAYAENWQQPQFQTSDYRPEGTRDTQERFISRTSGRSLDGDITEGITDGRRITETIPDTLADSAEFGRAESEGWQRQPGIGGDGPITLISGGFPCQPHSVAGKRKGSSDERNLWPEFRRVIGEIKPKWVLAENVPGLFSSDNGDFFGEVIADLAALGYSVGWCTYGAVDVGALHRRNRVFVVAHAVELRNRGWDYGDAGWSFSTLQTQGPSSSRPEILADSSEQGLEGPISEGGIRTGGLFTQCGTFQHSPIEGLPDWAGGEMGQPLPLTQFERPDGADKEREVELSFCGVPYGISRRVDRLKSLGNAVVPQQIYPVLKAIADIELALQRES